MNNIPNKMSLPSTPVYLDFGKKNSETYLTPTPMISQQTPQMIPQNYYSMNYNTSPTPDMNSPYLNKTTSMDLLHQQNNLQL